MSAAAAANPRLFAENTAVAPNLQPDLQIVPVTRSEQVAAVATLARDIWYEFYVPLIGRPQVDYMVQKSQNAAAIQLQIDQGYEYFPVRRAAGPGQAIDIGDIGYCTVQQQPGRVMFSEQVLSAPCGSRFGNRAQMHGVH